MLLLKRIAPCTLALLVCASAFAQQKQLTADQYFKGNFKGIIQPAPVVTRWTDDSHFMLLRNAKT